MKSTRRCLRFRVGSSFPMKAAIEQSRTSPFKIETLGEGGFGFFAPARDAHLMKHPVVDVNFLLGEKKIRIRGRVQYCKFLPKYGQNFIGIQFEEFDDRADLILRTIIRAAVAKGDLTQSYT